MRKKTNPLPERVGTEQVEMDLKYGVVKGGQISTGSMLKVVADAASVSRRLVWGREFGRPDRHHQDLLRQLVAVPSYQRHYHHPNRSRAQGTVNLIQQDYWLPLDLLQRGREEPMLWIRPMTKCEGVDEVEVDWDQLGSELMEHRLPHPLQRLSPLSAYSLPSPTLLIPLSSLDFWPPYG
jgi:hypothetical protein